MTSRKFFGNFRFKDVNVELFNDGGDLVYESHTTTFANVNPLIKDEVDYAVRKYNENGKRGGEAVRCELYTAPADKLCRIDLKTGKKEFVEY